MILYVVAFFLILLTVILLVNFNSHPKSENISHISETAKTKPCPICQWPLQTNERVHSTVYRSKEDAIMHIFGCPYCFKDHPKSKFQNSTTRTCPSCHKSLPTKEYAIARLFEKPGKNHVHVLGCYRCRGKK